MPPSERPIDPRRLRRRRLRRTLELVVLVATLVLAAQVLSVLDWSSLESQLRAADVRLVLLTVALLVSRWMAWNVRWRLALRRIGVVASRTRTLASILAGAALNHITPAFRILGGLVRARYIGETGRAAFGRSYGSVLWDQIINQVGAGIASAAAFIVLSWRLGRSSQSLVAVLIVAATLLLAPLLLQRLRRTVSLDTGAAEVGDAGAPSRWSRALAAGGRETLETLRRLFVDRNLLLAGSALTVLYLLLNLAAAWTAFASLGATPDPVSVFLAVSLGVTVGAISGTPGGGLTTEAAMVTCYVLLGADRSQALAATLLYRGLHYALVLSLGLPSLAVMETAHRRREVGESISSS